MAKNETYPDNDFPTPRRFEPTGKQLQYNNLARYVRLSKMHARRTSGRSKTMATALVGIIAALFLVGCLFHIGSKSLDVPFLQAESSQTQSTPRSEWTRGSAPYLYQTDPEWASSPYADGTIETHGCGPTCLSMAYVQLTGKTDKDPSAMATFSEQQGFIDSGVTSWLLMSEGADMLGLSSRELPSDANVVKEQIREGHPIICSVAAGDFTTDGHFIMLCGLDDQGNLIIRDPNSPERSKQPWSVHRVLSQCRNLWALSR